ncbi:H-NS family histone-like protein [Aeromonas jandaei]|uniref:H-NS family histone-like protein n=1 Tax=Aeromonas jandaei TaxID=650 RepID=UPI002AA0DE9F|nr:H-NS family nucleoid-associated regulatory protein [Aeromonas jandaei]
MVGFLKVFLNQRSLRVALRELSFAQLTEVKINLDMLISKREEDERNVSRRQAERQDKLACIEEMIKQAGITPSDLLSISGNVEAKNKARKRAPRPAKYRYQVDGIEKTWTGQGRMPKVIANAVQEGVALESYMI